MSADASWRARALIQTAVVFIVAAVAMGSVVLPAGHLVTIDGYYHFKIAQWIGSSGPWVDIRWLPLTVLGDEGPDHHWLWHVLLVPFTWFPDPFTGLKWATVITAAAVPACICWCLHTMRVPWPALFALLSWAGAVIMPGRLLMLRAQNVAIVGVIAALWCLTKGRYRLLALVSFAMMQAYHGAVLLVPLALLDMGLRRLRMAIWEWRSLVAVGVGLSAGLLLSPWFPENVDYLLFHTLYKITNPQQLAVGSEWLSPSMGHIFLESWPLWVCLSLVCVMRLRRTRERWSHEVLLWGGASLLCLALYLKAWRFAEYFVPVATVFGALLMRRERPPEETQTQGEEGPRDRWMPVFGVAMTVVVAFGGWNGVQMVSERAEFEPGKYEVIMNHLRAEAEPGELVFNRAWEDFVFLFWQEDDLRFVTGLDPNYLAYEDPGRFKLWMWIRNIEADEENDPAPLIRKAFGARWVVVDHHGLALASRLERSPYAHLVVHTRWGWLYEIQLPEDEEAHQVEP